MALQKTTTARGGDARGARGGAVAAALSIVATVLAANTLLFHSRVASWSSSSGDAVAPASRPPPFGRGRGDEGCDYDRRVPLLTKSAWTKDRHAFSGSWWQSTDRFVKMELFEEIEPSPEGASFMAFGVTRDDVRMTRDWLDLSVEHMSKWWKVVLRERNGGEEKLLKKLEERVGDIPKGYVRSPDRREFFLSIPPDGAISTTSTLATKSTIVALAYMADHTEKGIWSLAATVMSLVQTGMGRIVVTSDMPNDRKLVLKSFEIVNEAISNWTTQTGHATNATRDAIVPWTELEYCALKNATHRPDPRGRVGRNIPQATLRELRHVFQERTSPEAALCWLGGTSVETLESRRRKWRYTFLTEPDLLLATKPDALRGLGRALLKGRILAPHRLQPLPHGINFAGVDGIEDGTRAIPNAPPFDEAMDIDALKDTNAHYDACCDRGKSYVPHLVHEKCGTHLWWTCGLSAMLEPNSIEVPDGTSRALVAHKRLLGYPLMRLRRGTGVVFVSSNHGKTCRPTRGGCLDEDRGEDDSEDDDGEDDEDDDDDSEDDDGEGKDEDDDGGGEDDKTTDLKK